MISAVVCRVIVAYELAGQKIAARKCSANEQTKDPENPREIPPNPLSASSTHNVLNPGLPEMPPPNGGSRKTGSETHSSVELRYLNKRGTRSSSTARVADTIGVEEGMTTAFPVLGRASSLSNTTPAAAKLPSITRCARTEEV